MFPEPSPTSRSASGGIEVWPFMGLLRSWLRQRLARRLAVAMRDALQPQM